MSVSRAAIRGPEVLAVGPKECFKHILLNELLKATAARYSNGWTYVDFTPGPGKQPMVDGGLDALYAHGRAKYSKKEKNFFQSYIGSILRFNGETDTRALKESPFLENAPSTYFSNAGLACMHMDELDRGILIEEDQSVHKHLENNIREHIESRRVKVLRGDFSNNNVTAKALLPPINKRGLVVFDVDARVTKIRPKGGFDNKNFKSFGTHAYYMNDISELLGTMVKRWPTGTFYFPYPLTSAEPPVGLFREIVKSGAKQILNVSMYLEGDPKKHAAPFAGSGVGAIIVNPPANLDLKLHKHMPALKTEVFMPEILLDDDIPVSPVNVRHVLKKTQPWDHVETSDKLPSWEPDAEVKFTEEQLQIQSRAEEEAADGEFDELLDMPEDYDFDDIFEDAKFVPSPEKLDPELARSWASAVNKQAAMQDPVRPTIVRMRNEDAE